MPRRFNTTSTATINLRPISVTTVFMTITLRCTVSGSRGVRDRLAGAQGKERDHKGRGRKREEGKELGFMVYNGSFQPPLIALSQGNHTLSRWKKKESKRKENFNLIISWVDATKFLTGASTVGSIAIPIILKHADVITWGAFSMEISSLFVFVTAIFCFLGMNSRDDDGGSSGHLPIIVVSANSGYETWFSEFLMRVGDGEEGAIDGIFIRIPDDMSIPYTDKGKSKDDLIDAIFPSLQINGGSSDYIISRAILSTRNENVDEINDQLIDRFIGEQRVYYSFDEAEDDKNNFYPMEFLNSLNVSGLPPHYLRLKIGCPIILLRNIDPSN
ncbi:hypothetical protein LXL04_011490 [Taraxacum kok-saghyz]